MKKHITLFSFIFILLLSSCTKRYTCTCTTNIREGNFPPYQTVTVEEVKKNTSKKKAMQTCKNTAKQIEANTKLLFDNSLSIETGCALQESQ